MPAGTLRKADAIWSCGLGRLRFGRRASGRPKRRKRIWSWARTVVV